ncbi:hypothetical protein KPL42_07205 [Clostridium gasigenes]|uniref:DUF6418 domain-containing protein n=1 Tax=Clostridium gasigenes TaxID=94869 RepID=UPI001C0D7DF7|nr:DUF6418 domain-containing protein [Clostridium gasigenes]MBU3088277.1 hypothetical protein [Clostridium gasigenes]
MKFLGFFNGYMNQFLFITGAIYIRSERNARKRKCILIYILSLIYFVVIGNKFGALLLGTISFLLPIILINKKTIKFDIFKPRFFIFILVFLVIVIILSIKEYSKYSSVNNPFEYMLYRIFGLQGHTWWGVDYMYQLGVVDIYAQFKNEIMGIFKPDDMYYKTGMRFLMQLIAPEQVYKYYFESGINFATAYPAISIVSVGYIGTVIVQILFSYGVYKYLIIMKRALIRNDIILWFAISYIYSEIYYIFSMGSLSHVIRKMTFVLLIYIIIKKNYNYIIKIRSFKQ